MNGPFPMIEIIHQRGIHLPECGLWLDAASAKPFAFVSHAHGDHIARHKEVILSNATAKLMQARLGGQRREHILEFGKPAEFEGFRITLLPAGHILGSSQAFIETDRGSLLYTGDFKLRTGLACEAAEWCQADTLIMETTFGLPKYVMPPTATVVAQMISFCREAIAANTVPVLLAYSLGKSQELICALLSHGLTPVLHESVYRMTEIYRELAPNFPSGYLRYRRNDTAGKVLICPPNAMRSEMISHTQNRRTAVLTGWALDSSAIYRYRCNAAFPLTDHADYPDLIRYVELVKPSRILTLHGFASEFASDLRQRGYEAWALSGENQLELKLGGC